MQRPQRSEDERRGRRRAPAHYAPPRKPSPAQKGTNGTTSSQLRSPVRGWNQRRAGSDADWAMADLSGYAVSSLAPGPSPHRSPNDAR